MKDTKTTINKMIAAAKAVDPILSLTVVELLYDNRKFSIVLSNN